jgi:LPXTG-motif cell wall-anchored protein
MSYDRVAGELLLVRVHRRKVTIMRKLLVGTAIAGIAVVGAASPSFAADRTCEGSGELGTQECGGVVVQAIELTPVAVPAAVPAPVVQKAVVPTQNTLPVTGTESGVLAAAGVALIGGGVVLVTRSRRTESV